MRIVIATSNLGKVSELRALLVGHALEPLPPGFTLPEETGTTYEANARLKADAVAQALGVIALGDDSGLEVAALHDAPGLYSARYAPDRQEGEAQDAANRRHLLAELARSGVAPPWPARFICYLAFATPGAETKIFSGEARGEVVRKARGNGGFGYDPLLYYPPLRATFAELSEEEKNRFSHRALAVRALREVIG
jgi:XTP/dITP diphosphohydrolase